MYAAVPMTSPVRVSESPPITRATPKSVSLAGCARLVGCSGMRMFDGFTSRWTMPWACACPSASHRADRDLDDVPIRQPAGLEQRGERRSADQLGDEVRAVIVDGRLVQRDDRRVGQPRGDPGLALEPAADDAFAGENLDRDIAIEALVVAHPDGPEPARPEPPHAGGSGRARATDRCPAGARPGSDGAPSAAGSRSWDGFSTSPPRSLPIARPGSVCRPGRARPVAMLLIQPHPWSY